MSELLLDLGSNSIFSASEKNLKKKKVWDISGKQQEEQLLVVTMFRFFVFSGSSGGKPVNDSHILDLVDYQAGKDEAVLKFRNFTVTFNSSQKISDLSLAIQKMYSLNFPGMQQQSSQSISQKELGPCGGFSRSYRCVSDFYGIPVRDDICWEIDNLYETNQIKELNLSDWPEPPTPAQGKAMIEALKYNLWFESVVIHSNPACKISNDGMLSVNGVLQTNKRITRLVLQNIQARESWMTPETWMTMALNNYLHTIDLSNNSIEDRGTQSLCNDWLSTIGHEIQSINLSKCSIGKQGLSNLFRTLRQNKWISKNIKFLSISGNRLEDAASDMVLFLAEATSLRHFEMANSSPTWACLRPPQTITKSKETRQITRLDISGNKLNIKGPHDPSFNDLAAFLSLITPNLADIDLSSTNLPTSSIHSILSSIINLIRLNLSDNDLGEEGIINLVESLCHTTLPKLKHLYLNRNLAVASTDLITQTFSLTRVTSSLKGGGNVNTGSASNAVKALVNLISPASFSLCPLESLYVAGNSNGRLRNEIVPLAQALLKNDTITELDISGHHAGDDLAICLGRVLQVNRTIKTLYWDENLTTTVGMEYFATGFKRNQTIQHMPLPVLDIAEFLQQPENSPSMQMIKERLKLVDTTTTVQQRVTQLASDIQSQIINNNLRKMKEAINKAVSRKRNEAAISQTMSLASEKTSTISSPPNNNLTSSPIQKSTNDSSSKPEETVI
eukprot:gene6588-8155_t